VGVGTVGVGTVGVGTGDVDPWLALAGLAGVSRALATKAIDMLTTNTRNRFQRPGSVTWILPINNLHAPSLNKLHPESAIYSKLGPKVRLDT
jgi:hypothetical protein